MNHSPVSIAIGLLFIGSALIGVFGVIRQFFRSSAVEVIFRFFSRSTETKSIKRKQELLRKKQERKKVLTERERIKNHYQYEDEIRLSIALADRKNLFGSEHDQHWEYNPHDFGFNPTTNGVRVFCFLMFAEMAGRRVWVLKNDRSFWTLEKESYWQKICPKEVLKMIPNTGDLFRLKMEDQAQTDFDSDFLNNKKAC